MSSQKTKLSRTGDPKSAFHSLTPEEILRRDGLPTYLLGTSTKVTKCGSVGVLARVLYMTPGVYCPAATAACLSVCLGHTSGRMRFQTSVTARDKRAALYATNRDAFLLQLRAELGRLEFDAKRLGSLPAVRLNGTSDIPWEVRHRELFDEFPEIQFYDYTKISGRMRRFLDSQSTGWPGNYHLTYSAERDGHTKAREVLAAGGTVAVCFWPRLPETWWGFPVLSGDDHDARFLDPKGHIVGLLAKGLARVDESGFTVRPCPNCRIDGHELTSVSTTIDTHRRTSHRCRICGHKTGAAFTLAA